jgi:hypothetical protein
LNYESTTPVKAWVSMKEKFTLKSLIFCPKNGGASRTTDGKLAGSLIFAPLTALTGHKVLMGMMWIDRTNPQLPMFNPETEGLLRMRVLFSESADAGKGGGNIYGRTKSE